MAKRVLIVGAGAAGMMAAIQAGRLGANVTLLERNEKAGKKIYITGKGRCNLTNAAQGEDFMKRIVRNPRFLYASLAALDNNALMDLVEELGTPLKTERGERVFPESDKSSDVIAALRRGVERAGCAIRYDSRVAELTVQEGRVAGVRLENGERLAADAVILATGGLSYPSTGSTGDGLRFARDTGHRVEEPMPALVPIETKETWPGELTGLSLKNVRLTAWLVGGKKDKKLFSQQGEMLFTHFGVSGPLVLTMSSYLPEDLSNVRMEIDLKPALDEQTLDARLLRDFRELSRRQLATVMDGLEPHSLGMKLLEIAGFSPAQPVNSVTQEERRRLEGIVKHVPLTPAARRGFDEAIITRGGVSVKDIDPSTMQSKRTPGLYFAGEMIDVDAETGGFNLQIAFSTGALAGMNAAKEELA